MLGLGGSLLGVGLAQAALAAVPESLTEQAATAAGLAIVSTDLTGSGDGAGRYRWHAGVLALCARAPARDSACETTAPAAARG